jgi:cleavage and polyadenylation specificity factor subunit 4
MSNKKHQREVCRYWLSGRCQKGLECEFLHSIDYNKMPACVNGDSCVESSCCFIHPDPNRQICANYQIGFCSFGNRCIHKHVVEKTLPDISSYWTQDGVSTYKPRLSGKNFRMAPCDYYAKNKWCPYFDMCNFKH